MDVVEETGGDVIMLTEESSETEFELDRQKLRQRWELASVLNFLNVFEPLIRTTLKISAEEIEVGLIKPNSSLSKLHISLLKGIPPVSKMLDISDAWVAALCKKLVMWWPWVAEGEFPLSAAKGEELSKYRKLDPTTRLRILKALCEIRAEQDDVIAYINNAIKDGSDISTFRKKNIGGDGKGVTYWYDGDDIIGHRLYKEVHLSNSQQKVIRMETSEWKTIATDFDEFRKIAEQLSSSKVEMEAAVGKALESDAMPALHKLQKKKERALKRKPREQVLLNGFKNAEIVQPARSCRFRKPVSYTYDDYDKVIKDAIREMESKPMTGEFSDEKDHNARGKQHEIVLNGFSDEHANSRRSDWPETECGSDGDNQVNEVDESSSYEYAEMNDDSDKLDSDTKDDNSGQNLATDTKLGGERELGAKNRLRQRPIRNTAIESTIVSDSEDENS